MSGRSARLAWSCEQTYTMWISNGTLAHGILLTCSRSVDYDHLVFPVPLGDKRRPGAWTSTMHIALSHLSSTLDKCCVTNSVTLRYVGLSCSIRVSRACNAELA